MTSVSGERVVTIYIILLLSKSFAVSNGILYSWEAEDNGY